MYQALYRKYRPQTLEDICGQEAIVKIIKNSIINKMKPENTDKKLSNSEKTFNILRASTGVLVSLGFLPRLAEEYSASKRGYNMAKEAGLEEKLLNTINKNHKWGFKSYIRGAGMFAIAVTAAIQLKDFLENKMTNYHKRDLIK